MITSEYLNDAVNFKRPVLLLALDWSVQTNKDLLRHGQCLIWFAENIAE